VTPVAAPLPDPRLAVAERWFTHHGLPWFTDQEDARVAKVLRVRALVPAASLAILASLTIALLTGVAEHGTGQPLPRSITAGLVAGTTPTQTGRATDLWRTAMVRTRTRSGYGSRLTYRHYSLFVLVYVVIGVIVAVDKGYITAGLLKNIISALLAIFLWFLVLLGVDLNIR
jgi:hypothetical protein